jgi:hypothetical protein
VADLQETPGQPSDLDPLAAVVLHTLVSAAPRAIGLEQLIEACERDPSNRSERRAIEQALRGLRRDGLAWRRNERFAATRAAIRADALRF